MDSMIKRYDELYEDMATAKDPMKMMAFGDAEKWMFHALAEKHPELAEKWLTKLEASRWHNYLSESEAEEIAEKIVNQDGTRGPHWDYSEFKNTVESLGESMVDEPYYNCWALWIEANALYSDLHRSLSKYIPKEFEPQAYYEMAVAKLMDIDRPKFIREYYRM